MKIFAILCLTLLGPLEAQSKNFNISVLYWSMDIEGQVAMRTGIEEQVQSINKKGRDHITLRPFVAGNGIDGIKNQIKQFEKAIQDSPDLIIIQPTDNSALGPLLRKANKKKIPVVSYDQFILGGRQESFITSNNYQAGKLNAEYIHSLFPPQKKIRIILVEYPKVSSTISRVNGFFDTLKSLNRDYRILKKYEAVQPLEGKMAGKQILKDFPQKNSFDVIFAVNDGGGLSVRQEMENAKRFEVKMVSVDGDPKNVSHIKDGKIAIIDSAQFCSEIGRETLRTAYRLLKGKKVPQKILIPTFPVTKESVKFYPGWKGVPPKKFNKSWLKNAPWNGKNVEIY